jgi:hypothetical protein
MSRPVIFVGCWPRRLSADLSAIYVGEATTNASSKQRASRPISPPGRLRHRTGAPRHELLHSMPGTSAREGEIMDAFKDLRHRGEWFYDYPDLRTFVARVKTRGDRVGEATA